MSEMKLLGTRSPTAATRSSSAAQARREHPLLAVFWSPAAHGESDAGRGVPPGHPGVGVNSLGHVEGSGLVTNVAYRQELSPASSSLSCISCLGVCVWGL